MSLTITLFAGLRRGKAKPKKEKQEPIITICEHILYKATVYSCHLALSEINKEETINVLNYFVKLEHQKYLDRLI